MRLVELTKRLSETTSEPIYVNPDAIRQIYESAIDTVRIVFLDGNTIPVRGNIHDIASLLQGTGQ